MKNLNETLTDDLKNEVQKVVGLKESLDKAEQKTKDELASQKQRLVIVSETPDKTFFSVFPQKKLLYDFYFLYTVVFT